MTGTRSSVGGLVGNVSDSVVIGYSTGNVTGTGNRVSGLVGRNTGIVVGYATGNVNDSSGGNQSCGLVGYSEGNEAIVIGYTTGDMTGTADTGGLAGTINADSTAIGYATGTVSRGSGLVHSNDGTVVGYWDKESTGRDTSAGGTGISATRNIAYATNTGTYTDTNGGATIFDDANFIAYFDVANGSSKTWPKLKTVITINNMEYDYNFPQPTVSDTDGNGTIDVTY